MPLSVVEFQDPTGQIMVGRVPAAGTAEFITGSQLIVQDGQVAIFYRDGQPADGFKAGRHTLSTKNLPIISKLANLAVFAGKSPFRAYVYFAQLKTFINLTWGTPTPILFRDSQFKAVHLRARGAFSLRIVDPLVFLRTIVGSQGAETSDAIQEFIRRLILARFAKTLPSLLTTVLDLAAQYQDIEVGLKKAVHEDLAQYGLELVDLVVEAITVPDEVQQMIDRAAGARAVDESEIGRYQNVALADALRDSSKMGGGAIGDAIGLGAGIAMGQRMMGGAGQAPGGQPAVPPPIPAPVQWHVAIGGQKMGPFSQEVLAARIQSGYINRETLVWRQGMASWTPAGQVDGIAPLFAQVPPPLPPS